MEGDEHSHMILPQRRSAVSARRVFATQLDTDSASDGSDNNISSRKKSKGKKKATTGAKIKAKDKADDFQSTPAGAKLSKSAGRGEVIPSRPKSALSYNAALEMPSELAEYTTPRPRPRPKPILKKKVPTPPQQQRSVEDDSSDLTSIGSSRDSRSLSRDSSIVIVDATIPPKSHFIPGSSSRRDNAPPRNSSSWSLHTLGNFVWVLLDLSTQLVFNPGDNDDSEDLSDRLWWPAKIKSPRKTDIPLQVKLFGSGFSVVDIHSPCESNILPELNPSGKTRFQVPTFHPDSTNSLMDSELIASPRKRIKVKHDASGHDWKKKWHIAVGEMVLAIQAEADSDELPNVADAFNPQAIKNYRFSGSFSIGNSNSSQGISTHSGKGKHKRNEELSSEDEFRELHGPHFVQEDIWEPPLLDDELNVPGELVLAREKPPLSSDYWPAKLLAYLPPSHKKQQPKFTVHWLDGTVKDIPRSWFYTMQQKEFGTCKVGKFTSATVEVHNDREDDQLSSLDFRQLSPSPTPLISPPPKDLFTHLSIREQFVYTKGVLLAILKNEYLPTQERHQMFIQGGKSRKAVVGNSTLRGSVDPRDVEKLQLYVRQWCLRDGGRKSAGDQEDAQPHSSATEAPGFLTMNDGTPNLLGLETVHQGYAATSVKIHATPFQGTPQSQGLGDDNPDTNMLNPGSPAVTEPVTISSPVQPPPSSLPIGLEVNLKRDESFISDTPSTTTMMSDHVSVADTSVPPPSEQVDDLSDALSDLTDYPQDNDTSVLRNRLIGSPDYEALSPITKLDYCMNIILPEAVRQILLWRTGHRTSFELLSPREEQGLYNKGQQLLEERDWVGDITRYRKLMEQRNERKKGKTATLQAASTLSSRRRGS